MPRLLTFLFIFSVFHSLAGETDQIGSIKRAFENAASDEQRLSALNDLAWEYHTSNFDSSARYADLALGLAEELGDPYWLAVSKEMKAILFEISGELDEAIKLYMEVIPLRAEMNDEGLENTFNNLAIIFRAQENYEKALEYFRRSHEIEKENQNPNGIAGSLVNLAITYNKLGMTDTVPVLLKESLKISDDPGISLHASINLGDYYSGINLNDSAMTFFRLALPIADESDDLASACVIRIGIAEILEAEDRLTESEHEFQKAFELAQKINFTLYESRVHRGLSVVYRKQGKFEKALDELEKYLTAREQVVNEELVRVTNDLEQKYRSERQEREIAELELASIAQNLTAEKNRNQRTLLLFLAVMLLLFLGFMTYRFVNQRKVAAILRTKNTTIARALDERELLLREIHHRVKNNLQVVSSLLSIQGRDIDDAKAKDAISESKNRVHSMALIHQYLYSDSELASINMQEYIPNLCQKLFTAYKLDHDLIDLRVNVEPISLDIDTAIPLGIIINELITNSLKYAFAPGASGFIEVNFMEKGGKLHLQVKDNGRGMADQTRSEISFGMKLIKAFKEKLKAEIAVDGSNGFEVVCKIGKYKRLWPKNIEYSS